MLATCNIRGVNAKKALSASYSVGTKSSFTFTPVLAIRRFCLFQKTINSMYTNI